MARKALWTLAILLIGVVLLFGAGLNQSYDDATTEYTVENETVTQNFTSLVYVDNSSNAESFSPEVSVYNSSGVKLSPPSDYQWYTNGSLSFESTANTTDGAEATVTYQYSDHAQQTESGGSIMNILGQLLFIMSLLLAGRFVINSSWGT